MIRHIDSRDIPLILSYLTMLPNPPNTDEGSVEQLMRSETQMIFVDDNLDAICRIEVGLLDEKVWVPWLFYRPQTSVLRLGPLFAETTNEALTRFPQAETWIIEGELDGMAARAWQAWLRRSPGDEPQVEIRDGGKAAVFWPLGETARQARERTGGS